MAVALLTLLVATLVHKPLRIWPTPGPGSWQYIVWWPLFRGLNVLCFAVAMTSALDRQPALGLPVWLRCIALLGLASSTALFVYAFRMLGRDNSYGARDGLVADGIYRWSRNPQNAMLMVVYACLAVAADTTPAYLLCAAMIGVYFLMILAEEPWLAESYGTSYQRYCTRVPRLFNWRRAAVWLRLALRRRRVTPGR